mmetsp:Transcript_146031/g.364122  ORF Transcript_146031/g.364122 Transcript_146031/m.364122 type:complete len:260 (-) Transcript_146031:7415-8194(-)
MLCQSWNAVLRQKLLLRLVQSRMCGGPGSDGPGSETLELPQPGRTGVRGAEPPLRGARGELQEGWALLHRGWREVFHEERDMGGVQAVLHRGSESRRTRLAAVELRGVGPPRCGRGAVGAGDVCEAVRGLQQSQVLHGAGYAVLQEEWLLVGVPVQLQQSLELRATRRQDATGGPVATEGSESVVLVALGCGPLLRHGRRLQRHALLSNGGHTVLREKRRVGLLPHLMHARPVLRGFGWPPLDLPSARPKDTLAGRAGR